MTVKVKIEKILRQKFKIEHLQILDHTQEHALHSEAKKSGKGHYALLIVSGDFEHKSKLTRHRKIYTALEREFTEGIHALSIQALTPQEYHQVRSL